jgi:hypothetical protein
LPIAVFIGLPWIFKLPFAINPLSYILRTVDDFRACEFADSQKANDIHMDESQLFQIQNNMWPIPLKLARQFLNVLRLKVTNQANRRLSAARFRLDLQWHRRFCFKLPFRVNAILVPDKSDG